MNDVKEQPTGQAPVTAPAPVPSIADESLYGSTYQQPLQTYDQSQKQQDPEKSSAKPSRNTGLHRLSTLLGAPLNKAAHLVGAEGWWPSALPAESDKAARILYSFTDLPIPAPTTTHAPKHPTGLTKKSIAKIPPPVLQACQGLAIFNTLRLSPGNGSLAAGSGVVVARRTDGSWSPPSAFLVTTLGAGFSLGLDMYEVVCVLNTPEQVAAFTHPRLSLGGEMSLALGPTGAGVNVEAAVSRTGRPVWSYIKSRGLWFGIQIDGTVMVSRHDANHAFYGRRVSSRDILMGDVQWPEGGKALLEVLRGVDGMLVNGHLVNERAQPVQTEEYHHEFEQQHQDVPPPGYLPEAEGTRGQEGEKHEETVIGEKERLARSGY